MSEIYESIMKGISEAICHAEGENIGRTHQIVIPDCDVRSIRDEIGLSQTEFAQYIGISTATLQNWESNRRQPQGPARVLLGILQHNPNIVQETFARQK